MTNVYFITFTTNNLEVIFWLGFHIILIYDFKSTLYDFFSQLINWITSEIFNKQRPQKQHQNTAVLAVGLICRVELMESSDVCCKHR